MALMLIFALSTPKHHKNVLGSKTLLSLWQNRSIIQALAGHTQHRLK